MTQDYNGWTNYETWNVALWMDNDETEYQWARSCHSFKEYRDGTSSTTGDGVSLYDPKLNHKELDETFKEYWVDFTPSDEELKNANMFSNSI